MQNYIMGALVIGLAVVNIMLSGCGLSGAGDSGVVGSDCSSYPVDDYNETGSWDGEDCNTYGLGTATKDASDDCQGDDACVTCVLNAYNTGYAQSENCEDKDETDTGTWY